MGIIFSSFNGLEPKLRFKDFKANWQTSNLSDYAFFLQGLTYHPEDINHKGTLVLRSSNIQNSLLDFEDSIYVRTEIVPNKIRTQKNDVLMCVRNGSKALVGKTALITSPYCGLAWGAFMTILRPKHNNTLLFFYLNSPHFRKQIYADLDTATVKQITMQTLNSIKINIPSLPEQQKIADFLSLIDQRIEKQRQLVESLKKYKRGALSRIFSNFENWEKTEAKDIATIETGCSNTQDNNPNGLYPFYIRSANIARSDKYIFDGEAVLTIGDGQIGKIYHYINGKFDCHQRVYMITKFKKISGRYFYHFFSTFFYNRAIKMSAKNTVDSVRMDMIAKMPIYFPDKAKQKQIVSTLDTIDSFIDKQTKLLEQMTSLKKGFLQQMFI